ncbi:unnamed protein product [Microthlaspi erraticum]|uniref:Uncharacterized protein n=1 Tax=Microthlaspi erraticum TaxID=1685480 RepID=A0A6D2LLR9_9BRAS|nr:unnamed protein product [Microthlaspi erraticum]
MLPPTHQHHICGMHGTWQLKSAFLTLPNLFLTQTQSSRLCRSTHMILKSDRFNLSELKPNLAWFGLETLGSWLKNRAAASPSFVFVVYRTIEKRSEFLKRFWCLAIDQRLFVVDSKLRARVCGCCVAVCGVLRCVFFISFVFFPFNQKIRGECMTVGP